MQVTASVSFDRETNKGSVQHRAVFSGHSLRNRQVRTTPLCNEAAAEVKRLDAPAVHSSDRDSLSSSTDEEEEEEEELSSEETPEVCTST